MVFTPAIPKEPQSWKKGELVGPQKVDVKLMHKQTHQLDPERVRVGDTWLCYIHLTFIYIPLHIFKQHKQVNWSSSQLLKHG